MTSSPFFLPLLPLSFHPCFRLLFHPPIRYLKRRFEYVMMRQSFHLIGYADAKKKLKKVKKFMRTERSLNIERRETLVKFPFKTRRYSVCLYIRPRLSAPVLCLYHFCPYLNSNVFSPFFHLLCQPIYPARFGHPVTNMTVTHS